MVSFWIDSWDWGCSPPFSSVDSRWGDWGREVGPYYMGCCRIQCSLFSYLTAEWAHPFLNGYIADPGELTDVVNILSWYLWGSRLGTTGFRITLARLSNWVLGITGSRTMPSLVLDRIALPQTDLVHNVGVLLDLQILLEKKVAVMARRTFAKLCVVLCLLISRSGAFTHSQSLMT